MRKKLMALTLAAGMAIALTACGGSSDSASTGSSASASGSSGSSSAASSSVSESGSTSSSSGSSSAASGETTAAGDLKIAIIPMSLNDPYQIMMANAAKMHCDELGIEGVIQAAGSGDMGDVQGQVELVENVVGSGTYDGAIIAPISADEGLLVAETCLDAGIKVCLIDSQIDQEQLEADGYEQVPFVGTGNYDAAVATGEWIKANYPEGIKMGKIDGADGHSNGEARKAGIDDGLDGWAEIVGEQSTTWAVDDAYTITQNFISANPDIELIWCACDALGIGACRALEEANMQDKVDVIAFDGTVDGLNMVLEGSEVANTAQFPDVIGSSAVDVLVKVLNGEDYELVTDSGSEVIVPDTAQALIDRLSAYL